MGWMVVEREDEGEETHERTLDGQWGTSPRTASRFQGYFLRLSFTLDRH